MARLILYLSLFLWHLGAYAQTPGSLVEQAFLKDPQAQFSLEQAVASEFQPYAGRLRLGFQPGAVWIRLKIDQAGLEQDASSLRRVVRVGPNYLEQIGLYAPAEREGGPVIRGALTPQASRDCPDEMHCFVVEASADGPSTLYLRILHRGFLVPDIEVVTLEALPHAVARHTRGLTISLAMALGLLVIGSSLLMMDRSLLLLAYCGYQLTIVFFIASNAGLFSAAFPSLSGEMLSRFNSFLYVLRATMSCCLGWAFLRPHQPTRLYLQGAVGLIALCGISVVLIGLGHVQLALKGALLVFSLIPFWYLYGTWTAKVLSPLVRRILIGGCLLYILVLCQALWFAFSEQHLMPQTGFVGQVVDLRLNGFAVGALFFGITMLERSFQKRARDQELDALRHQALEEKAQQAELAERNGLIDMLTHELKNPLGTIQFAIASLRQSVVNPDSVQRLQSIGVSARRMDDLIERVASFSKVERSPSLEATSSVNAFALIQELLSDVSQPEQWVIYVQHGATFHCNQQLLWVILENLMSNAEKYSMPEHKIHVEVTLEDDGGISATAERPVVGPVCMVRFEISNHVDQACIPDASSLFDRYYRHPNVQGKSGMGLGLSVVKTAVGKIGGKIAYRHEDGQVFFTVMVPA
jgi:signal transduction histidine kinase